MGGVLMLCGTPIGNLEDASKRLIRTLEEVDCIACEDPRRTKKLLTHFGVRAHDLVVLNEGNERRQSGRLLQRLKRGDSVALVSDAGMPGLSDPGFRLVRGCVEEGIEVGVVPGPTAAVTALAISGLPPGRFAFEGFLPRKPGDRAKRVAELATERRTMVFYVSPHRIEVYLSELTDAWGDRPACLARELTKMFEEVRRGSLSGLLDGVRSDPPKGEIVLLVGGASVEPAPVEPEELAARARALMDEGVDRKEAMSRVARETGVKRRQVFDSLLADKQN
ncbi:MAG: 16S rRNA (cytidine(1402)-2'-O)-methyltransferase [Actinomycetota bacterium]|nr:16S rRNA (cytidine(1402)-2'-O)-methyltransferase [Actinomycetota bacterium]